VGRKFWHAPDNSDELLSELRNAPWPLVYADMLTSTHPRMRDAAKNGGPALLELSEASDGFLDPIAPVVETALAHADGLTPDDVMVVGAWCRDILHSALGHSFATTATLDLDLALALSSWSLAAAKLGAWLDRSDWLEAKDAADLALVLHWCAESLARWPGDDADLLIRELELHGGPTWPREPGRRHDRLEALTRGLTADIE
jgi:hypothetical protein